MPQKNNILFTLSRSSFFLYKQVSSPFHFPNNCLVFNHESSIPYCIIPALFKSTAYATSSVMALSTKQLTSYSVVTKYHIWPVSCK